MKDNKYILSKYETYVIIGHPHNQTPIFLQENVLQAMQESNTELLNAIADKIKHGANAIDALKCFGYKEPIQEPPQINLHRMCRTCQRFGTSYCQKCSDEFSNYKPKPSCV